MDWMTDCVREIIAKTNSRLDEDATNIKEYTDIIEKHLPKQDDEIIRLKKRLKRLKTWVNNPWPEDLR